MASLPNNKPVYLQAGTSRQLVKQLQDMSSLATSISLPMFMTTFANGFADRTQGLIVHADTTDNFVADLISYGWIKIVS